MHHRARLDSSCGHIPQLLDAQREHLRLIAFSERHFSQQVLRHIAAHAVGENRDLCMNVDAGLIGGLAVAMPADAAIARSHPDDPIVVHQHPGRGNPRKYVDAFRLDEDGQPLAELLKRDDEVAVVAERRRREGEFDLAGTREKQHAVIGNRRRQRRAARLEIGDQLRERAGIEYRARQQMRARLAGFLEHGDGQRLAGGLLQLRQPKRRRQSSGPPADNQHVDVETLSISHHCKMILVFTCLSTQRHRARRAFLCGLA